MGEAIANTKTENPRIYVACLAAYNNGYLHGSWIDAEQDAWAIYDDVKAMLAASPIAEAEEWAIHDYEGFGNVRISEYAGFAYVSELAAFIAEHGELGLRSEEHTSELQSLMRISYAVFCLKKKITTTTYTYDELTCKHRTQDL